MNEAEQERDETQRLGNEADAKRRAQPEERRGRRRVAMLAFWPQSPPARFVAVLIVGAAVLGAIAVWIVKAPPTHAPITSAPVPAAPNTNAVFTLSSDQERALKPKVTFKECSNCPQMVVVPGGSFTMGSPANERGRFSDEGPQRTVTFARQFAVGQSRMAVAKTIGRSIGAGATVAVQ